MGIEARRERERERRKQDIVDAAWIVASERGWSGFSMERVASQAEIGRATIYTYFISIDELVVELATVALGELQGALAGAETTEQALDVPVRMAQRSAARFELLFPGSQDPRAHMSSRELCEIQARARELLQCIERIAARQSAVLPEDARDRAAFLAGVSMAGATVPELRSSTTLRHRWQHFCLGEALDQPPADGEVPSSR